MMGTLEMVVVYGLSVAVFLAGLFALFVGKFPVSARHMVYRMASGRGVIVAGLVFALGLPGNFLVVPRLGKSEVLREETARHTEAVLEVGREMRRLADENIRNRDESKEGLLRREQGAAKMANLAERLRVMQQEHQNRLADGERNAARYWQWIILALSFGLGMLIARYTGESSPIDEKVDKPTDKRQGGALASPWHSRPR